MSEHRLIHEHKGRSWTCVGRVPYTRKDGSTTELMRWRIQCAKCEEMVDVTTPSTSFETSHSFDMKHCAAHKLTNEEIFALGRAQKRANKQKKAAGNA